MPPNVNSPRSEISLRRAILSDLPTLADLATEAFFFSPLDLQFFPRHFEFPSSYQAFFLREFKMRLASPDNIIIVAEAALPLGLENGVPYENLVAGTAPRMEERSRSERVKRVKAIINDEKSTIGMNIVGYAAWIRCGPRTPAFDDKVWGQDSISKRVHRLGLQIRALIALTWFHVQSVRAMRSFHLQACKIVEGLNLGSWIDLSALAVKEDWQRKGIGRMLLDWGLEVADEELIPCVLEATGEGSGLYKSRNFRAVGEVTLAEREVMGSRRHLPKRRERVKIAEVRMPVMLRSGRLRGNGPNYTDMESNRNIGK